MGDNLILLSRFIIQNPQVSSFSSLIEIINKYEGDGPTMLQIDIKPDFADTPRNWESQVEMAFSWGGRSLKQNQNLLLNYHYLLQKSCNFLILI